MLLDLLSHVRTHMHSPSSLRMDHFLSKVLHTRLSRILPPSSTPNLTTPFRLLEPRTLPMERTTPCMTRISLPLAVCMEPLVAVCQAVVGLPCLGPSHPPWESGLRTTTPLFRPLGCHTHLSCRTPIHRISGSLLRSEWDQGCLR